MLTPTVHTIALPQTESIGSAPQCEFMMRGFKRAHGNLLATWKKQCPKQAKFKTKRHVYCEHHRPKTSVPIC